MQLYLHNIVTKINVQISRREKKTDIRKSAYFFNLHITYIICSEKQGTTRIHSMLSVLYLDILTFLYTFIRNSPRRLLRVNNNT